MNLEFRINKLVQLGEYIIANEEELQAKVQLAYLNNNWFTKDNTQMMLSNVAKLYLNEDKLRKWVSNYSVKATNDKRVALILAGNIPMVGFHDVLCSYISGHTTLIKYSDKDEILIPHLLEVLNDPSKFESVERLENFDAIIATGSNNSARYFHSYFSKYPHIIRKNRNGVAVIQGDESEEDILALGKDIFSYFGLGCRSVAKIYVPENYSFDFSMECLDHRKDLIQHNKYKNNFDYNYALLLLNKDNFYYNGCLIVKEDKTLFSRISSVHFEYYKDEQALQELLKAEQENIQCVVSKTGIEGFTCFNFGEAQTPALNNYADGVDTMSFLNTL
jgi:hypothetical protein